MTEKLRGVPILEIYRHPEKYPKLARQLGIKVQSYKTDVLVREGRGLTEETPIKRSGIRREAMRTRRGHPSGE